MARTVVSKVSAWPSRSGRAGCCPSWRHPGKAVRRIRGHGGQIVRQATPAERTIGRIDLERKLEARRAREGGEVDGAYGARVARGDELRHQQLPAIGSDGECPWRGPSVSTAPSVEFCDVNFWICPEPESAMYPVARSGVSTTPTGAAPHGSVNTFTVAPVVAFNTQTGVVVPARDP